MRSRPPGETATGQTATGESIAAGLTTLRAALAVFARYGSPRLLLAGLVTAVVARLAVGAVVGWSWWDLAALGLVVALVPFVEWIIHLFVLHAEPRRLGRLRIDTGYGHREHHLNPATIHWVLLRWVDAALFQVTNALVVVAVVGGPLWALGAPVLGPVLTGIAVAVAALGHYEWSHFLFHVAYRPKTRYYRRLKANHRLHHWRNERYWLGVTTNLGDRVLGTYPASKSDVPRSPTARTLGSEPED